MSSHNAQEPMDPGDLERKHRVFLCHSGAQKAFVHQLDKDLRSVDRYPFFDQDRESLPIGDNFSSLICEAIERCQVGVVFLSEDFFVWSHWPMFEVVRMVECGRRIMPIFLGISPGDLSNEEKVAKWKSSWEVWAESNRRIDVARWESTLRSLRPLNGLVYNDAIGEVKFREEIVKEVCKIVPPFHVWDDSHVQGRSRISMLIQMKISESPMSKKGVQVIGLYGVGGIGKTTACKSLCKGLLMEFDGRVCHIEFGDGTSEVDRLREVLKRLTKTDNEFLKDRKLDECWSRLKGLLRSNKVVLAIDNVSSYQKTCDEVEKYLSLEYGQGSVVMVTARALGELRNLSIETSNCLEMPELVADEARALFLNHANPKSAIDEEIVMKCVNQCYFEKGDGNGSKHYHPLALKVLGSQVIGRHPLEWILQLNDRSYFREDAQRAIPYFEAMAGDDGQRAMDPGDPGPKGFQVFLSHSGRQKAFVAQLDKDLRGRDVHPFFDEDVEKRCLLIGEKVQDRIFKAIEDCRVGVVILSEDFFTRRVWPMLELEKMVECKKKIMPVFLGISPDQVFNESKLEEWISAWKGLEQPGVKINIANWIGAVEHLREVKGLQLEYCDATGVVKFRAEIVKEIRKVVPQSFWWDDSHVRGGARLSKVIQAKIRGIPTTHEGVQVVGLHGIGGIGKTTACKSLCKDLFMEFDGRVCHIEFGADSSERSELERVQKVSKRLTDLDNGFLNDRNKDECWSLLRKVLASKEPLSPNKVFLAIDNVSVDTRDEVRRYRSLEFDRGSIVMVTARELDELKGNNIDISKCLVMPELVEEEARDLFVYYAEPKKEVDKGVIMEYFNQFCFGKGHEKRSQHYHPLALKVLGSQMVGKSPSEWKSQLKQEVVCLQDLEQDHPKVVRCQDLEQDHPVLSVLRRSFDSLRNKDKMLFIDVALLNDGGDLRNSKSNAFGVGSVCFSDFIDNQWFSGFTIFEWLSIVHGICMDEVKKRLNVLKKRGFLEEVGDGRGQIVLHDLWQEFAIMETKRGEEEELQWVYEKHVLYNQWRANSCMSCMSGGGWKKLRRIFIQESILESIDFSECLNVTVLRLINVYVENGALDLSHLKSIKSLEIVHPSYDYQLEVSGIGELYNLVALIWLGIQDKSINAVEEISCLTNLQIMHLKWDLAFGDCESSISLDLRQLKYLRDVRVEIPSMVSISGFSSQMKGLRILDLAGCHRLRSCTGVGDVDGLEVLLLSGCRMLEELPNLQKLIRLRILDIHGCELLKALRGLGSLVSLQVLYGGDACLAMKELPSMGNLAKLEVLDLRRCCELKCIRGLGNLVALRELGVNCGWLHSLPDLGNLRRLQEVEIYCSNSDDCKGHDAQKLIARGFEDGGDGVFRREPSDDEFFPSARERNRHADEQAAVDAPNDLVAGPSRLAPCTIEFIPYNESLSEFGIDSVPKPASKLGSSSGSAQEHTFVRKKRRRFHAVS